MALIGKQIIELAKQGSAIWNDAWANKLLRKKQEIIEDGTWSVDEDFRYGPKGKNDITQEWLDKSTVKWEEVDLTGADFTDCIFPGPVDFRGAYVKKENKFDGAEFHESTRFDSVRFENASFERTIFKSKVYFDGCSNQGEFDFSTAEFEDYAWFQAATINRANFWRAASKRAIYFNGTTFGGYSNIEWCDFQGYASFIGATFNGNVKLYTSVFEDADFKEATFKNDANFRAVRVRDLRFDRAVLEGMMDFRELSVTRACSFRGVRTTGDLDFGNARFNNPPDLTVSTFRREPRLDSVRIRSTLVGFYTRPPSGIDLTERRQPRLGFWIDEDAPAKFRELKKIAASTNDLMKELDFHAGEIRSARFATDWPIPWPGKRLHGIPRFWFGLCYGLLSDFGRSITRPLLWWLALVAACAVLYLGHNPEVKQRRYALEREHSSIVAYVLAARDAWLEGQACTAGLPESVKQLTNVTIEAIQLATMNAVVFADSGADGFRRAYGCLFGLENSGAANSPPIISPTVNWIGRMQRAASVMLLFLFGLGLRNMLRMK